ncbi:oxidoreductase, short chain dehydrogenase/reductase family protein [Necator americanus]|uniref:Oxidoreductase, short chain dehydrogenase/reductase family protein n=1 Tax=Necator americanus TaxID=51031 RepID=W2SIQ1_NECAM|nr:oxidoreductase, short chain dehydrogenase/reductase family protein [Necator americanus]ETN69460.1 oxidoreductase, short chain dehydrogenase/reductase family protein [Necator americanus]
MALRLAQLECRIILSARRKEKLEELKAKCDEKLSTRSSVVLPLDVTDFSQVSECSKKVKTLFGGKIDVIILCSGQSQRAEWIYVDHKVDEACFRVNALGPTVLAREYMKTLEPDKNGVLPFTHFVVVSSVAGVMGAILSPSYTAAKHALMGYFRVLAMEYSSKGIEVSLVCPSLTFAPNNLLNAFSGDINKPNGEVLAEATPAHMSPARCAQLILLAASNRIAECWLSQKASLLILCYCSLLMPGITNRIVQSIGVERLKNIRTGGVNK